MFWVAWFLWLVGAGFFDDVVECVVVVAGGAV